MPHLEPLIVACPSNCVNDFIQHMKLQPPNNNSLTSPVLYFKTKQKQTVWLIVGFRAIERLFDAYINQYNKSKIILVLSCDDDLDKYTSVLQTHSATRSIMLNLYYDNIDHKRIKKYCQKYDLIGFNTNKNKGTTKKRNGCCCCCVM